MTDISRLLTHMEERQEDLLDLVKTLVSYETPAPPARNTAEIQAFIASYLEKAGYEIDSWDVYPGDPNVVATKKGTDSAGYHSLILNGHVDTAEVEGSEWKTNPYRAEIENGWIQGRGTADMKGGLAGALFVIRMFHELEIELPGDLMLQSVIGEEVGEAGTLACCRRGYTADYALVVDTSDLHIQGQGGVITGWITIKSPDTFHDAMRRNMIHAGGAVKGASAIEKMMVIIQGLQTLERQWAVEKSYPGLPAGANTINPAVIEGGRHAAFIADECRLWVTVHFYPDETHESAAAEVEEHIRNVALGDPWLRHHPPEFIWGGTSMIEERGEIFPSLSVDREHPGTKLLAQAFEKTAGEKAVLDVSPTVTDGGWLGEAGIPTAIFGPGTLANAHAVNERLSIEQLVTYTNTLAVYVYEWLHSEKKKEE
ncbi:acetylornithine deacetylase [Sinobaca qinghaiensis]|uniref:Acetylornithine deacetylase n=1 Tax=Sinobaca qinghaiensis TaxID=342944 RepID=A0A419V4I5_9BACL|nr:acetylornithine deacetylase [Sinobaca qinghaiensis]RKD73351.1 acetylornithine deacetylase [Sinobaca qinghaiensis]